MNRKEETDTFSNSDDNVSISRSCDDDECDDEDDEETSLLDDLKTSWRQHFVAILIAVVATALSYLYQHLSISPSISSKISSRFLSARYDLEEIRHYQLHAHTVWYKRTANVSFCGGSLGTTLSMSEFGAMDFHIPESLISTMVLHYRLDYDLLDDENASGKSYFNAEILRIDGSSHPELQCLHRLQNVAPHKFIKGITYFYKSPSIESMYRNTHEKVEVSLAADSHSNDHVMHASVLTFTGFSSKFVNMGTYPVLLYWDGRGGDDRNRRLVGEIPPFEALTTATRPGESFSVSPLHDHSFPLDRWTVTADDATQYYEPSTKKILTQEEEVQYKMQKLNQEFAKHYLIHSGRSWLSHFPRAFPIYHMWTAEYFGQVHTADSEVLHDKGDANSKIEKYTLEVASVTPRVFKIRNFLSASECDTLIQTAVQNGLLTSTVNAGGNGTVSQQRRDFLTRFSSNTWITRDHHMNLTDSIYRRASHILKIDESYLGHKAPIDDSVDDAKYHSIAESLQVIRYKKGEEYAPHHDWVLPRQQNPYQPSRFATLLIYLNDDYEGGQTVFPRSVNQQYHEGIKIQPQQGTAILFYNMLPDGNVDDLSQHGSEKVTRGEKVRSIF
jgi:prolyl 4-hydroxylase